MTRKRKPSKDSPDNGQSSSKPNTNKRNKGKKMAQNAHASPVTNLSGQSQASQASQSSQFYGSPQLTQMPYSYMMNTPNFYGQGFIPPGTPSPLPSSDILSSILERLNSVDKKLSQLDQIQQTVSGIVSRIDKI
ncbi:hypothetical protein DPMN_120314 [Dreissena polymorpha]|uniref:Uncharacterized protein n=1 Tax=Dreissena polymorpha TaxID=45954 RepID=A0A9D4GKM1_DREPO|nr:hypothetical protein DPMN_120314 [Dreissena polymorpha]